MPADDRTALLDFLSDRDTPCPACTYSLRGLTEPRCPECGQPLKLSVNLQDPATAAWIVLTVAVCGTAGLGLILACIFARAGHLPDLNRVLNVTAVAYTITIPLPLVLLRSRKAFQRAPRARQWFTALLAAGGAVLMLGVMCLYL